MAFKTGNFSHKLAISLAFSLSVCGSTWIPCLSADAPAAQLKGSVKVESSAADRLFADGKYAEAAAAYQKVLASESANLTAQAALGMALVKQFKLDAALEQFDKVIVSDPRFARAHTGIALVTMYRLQGSNKTYLDNRTNLLKTAEQEARLATELAPQSPEAQITLGNVLKEQGRLDEAAKQYEETIKLDARNTEALTQLATIQLAQNKLEDAQANFQKSIELGASNSTAHYGLGRVYLKLGKVDDALKELNTALYLSPNSAPVHDALGAAYEAQGNTVAAVREYQESIRIKPENLQAYFRIADIHSTRGDLEQSITDLHSALELEPNNSEIHLFIATQLLGLERFNDAITEFKTVLEFDPNSIPAGLGLARASYLKDRKDPGEEYFRSAEFAEATKALDRLTKQNPKSNELQMAQDKLRMLSGRAIRLAEIGEPQNLAESLAMYELMFEGGKINSSDRLATKMIGSADTLKQVLQIADTALLIRDLNNAETAYKRAEAMDKGSQRVRLALSRVNRNRDQAVRYAQVASQLAKRKQLSAAIQKYNDALACDPRLASAQLELAKLMQKLSYITASDLRDAAGHYRCYLELSEDLQAKERTSIQKIADKLDERATKIKS